MKINRLLTKAILIGSLATLTMSSNAAVNPANATPGSSGGVGLANLTISATVLALFRISGLADITFAAYSGSGVWTGTDGFCVYTNGAAGVYRVTATGTSGAGAGFNLHNGTNTMAYTVDYTDATPVTAAMTSGTALTLRQGHATSSTCGGADNASVLISISQAVAQAAPASGTAYTGTLTFLIAP